MFKKLITVLSASACLCKAQVSDFENLTLSGANSNFVSTVTSDFSTNAIIKFKHEFASGYWDNGFSYSNVVNTTLAGYANQYAAITGKGYENSNNYVVSYNNNAKILFSTPTSIQGFYFTNSTYAYLSMKNGDAFAKKFTGPVGTFAGDYFKVKAQGFRNGVLNTVTGIDFYLADMRNTNNSNPFILNTWKWVSLGSLGLIDSLQFNYESSDVGKFGINTPKYFIMDNFNGVAPFINVINNENITNMEAKIYPNPATNTFKIISNEYISNITISDCVGRLIATYNNTLEIDISSLKSGIYVIEINNKSRLKLIKL